MAENRTASSKQVHLCDSGLNFEQIKELMTHMKKEGVTQFELGEGKTKLVVSREKEVLYTGAPAFTPYEPITPLASAETAVETNEVTTPIGEAVTSPVVGVFYEAPAPDQDPYVSVGAFVKKGDVLCIVEAMKLMNEVTSPATGVVKEICVKNASRVEYGQTLFRIEPGVWAEDNS